MKYYVIRIYRREPRRGNEDTRLTGLLEDEVGRREVFHNAEELWGLLVRSASDGANVSRNFYRPRNE